MHKSTAKYIVSYSSLHKSIANYMVSYSSLVIYYSALDLYFWAPFSHPVVFTILLMTVTFKHPFRTLDQFSNLLFCSWPLLAPLRPTTRLRSLRLRLRSLRIRAALVLLRVARAPRSRADSRWATVEMEAAPDDGRRSPVIGERYRNLLLVFLTKGSHGRGPLGAQGIPWEVNPWEPK